ncbi:zinc finger and SCAN domain-containing protein 23-like [Silurus meridionalis]|uniref:C2H2-type domain-containing protein n=1 Tax=Silurus meridionalis TaxID=175797 RepID=A0A8T0AJJ8_SILME|nr:zinc finger and SCAN domain-containing protein 23-like [Silurus meridionalis]KAF7690957.1 hypothetical protein HF521_011254 [Silurus meridionalis]KAI5091011.1 zinc finger protein 83-like [Silurus meridionalis]
MAEPRCFQTQLNSIMEIMSRALVRQICKLVDSDLATLRLELERAMRDNAALADKTRALEGEVAALRGAGARATRAPRTSCRSVCVQTTEDAPPSINGIFGKEWCSSLWDGRPRTEQEVVEVELDISEVENDEERNVRSIKEEVSDQEICIISPTSRSRKKTSSDPHNVPEDVTDDDDIHFISAGFPETSDVDVMAPDSPGAAATKLISMDGTVQHVIVSGDDDDDDEDDDEGGGDGDDENNDINEEDQLGFEQHCMPIEFMEGDRGEAAAYERQSEVEKDVERDVLTDPECMSSSGGGSTHIFNYFDRFNIHHRAGPGNDSGKTDFTCPECGKTFLRRNGLTLHMKSHQKHNAHTCRVCKVIFPQKNLLRTHKCLPPEKMSPKTADMRFRCEVCSKFFHSKANLKVHYAVHTGERPHTCSFCGRGFSQKGNLTTHERIHKGERPYVCTLCGKSFTQKGNLTHHLAIHSKMNGRMRNAVEKWQ